MPEEIPEHIRKWTLYGFIERYGNADKAYEGMAKCCIEGFDEKLGVKLSEKERKFVCAQYIDWTRSLIKNAITSLSDIEREQVLITLSYANPDLADEIENVVQELKRKYGIEEYIEGDEYKYRLKGVPKYRADAIFSEYIDKVFSEFVEKLYDKLGDFFFDVHEAMIRMAKITGSTPPPIPQKALEKYQKRVASQPQRTAETPKSQTPPEIIKVANEKLTKYKEELKQEISKKIDEMLKRSKV
jgi:hypothetical protein